MCHAFHMASLFHFMCGLQVLFLQMPLHMIWLPALLYMHPLMGPQGIWVMVHCRDILEYSCYVPRICGDKVQGDHDVLVLWHWLWFGGGWFFRVDFHQPPSLWEFPSAPNHLCIPLPFSRDLGWAHVGCSSAYWSAPTGVVHCWVVDVGVQTLLGHLMYLVSGGQPLGVE